MTHKIKFERNRLHCRKCVLENRNPNILEVDLDEDGWFVGCYTCGFGYDRDGFKTREDAEKSFMERGLTDG